MVVAKQIPTNWFNFQLLQKISTKDSPLVFLLPQTEQMITQANGKMLLKDLIIF